MNTVPQSLKPRIAVALLFNVGAAALGGVLSYDFAVQAGGSVAMALLTGSTGALFSTLMADALASRLSRRR